MEQGGSGVIKSILVAVDTSPYADAAREQMQAAMESFEKTGR